MCDRASPKVRPQGKIANPRFAPRQMRVMKPLLTALPWGFIPGGSPVYPAVPVDLIPKGCQSSRRLRHFCPQLVQLRREPV